ncbi:MAG TPA: MFS transporter [Rubrobacter sp.]|nr:MFS transporter [Rubrobacter sp.]
MILHVLVLSVGSFAVGTGTFVVTGVLTDIAEALSVSVANAGLLVTVFAVTFAIGSPVLVSAASGVERRRLLSGALLLFALANVAAAFAPNFSLLLGARVVAACGAAIFTPVASSVAAGFAPPGLRGRALSVRTIGVNIAWLVGVPLGTLIGGQYGWRTSFVLVAGLAAVAALGIRSLLSPVEASGGRFLSNLTVVKRGAVVVGLGLTLLALMSSFVVLTYVRPVLENLTDFDTQGVGLMLAIFGLASIPGALLGGYVADRWGYRVSMIAVLIVLSVSLFSFSVLSAAQPGSVWTVLGTGTVLVTWSVAAFAFLPLQQYRLIVVSPPEGQSTALSLNASAIQAGQGIGALLGALTLHYGSVDGLGWVGAACALGAFAALGYRGRSSPL